MALLVQGLIFLAGLACIVKGGDAFVGAAAWMAKASGIPEFVVGATVVSLATTLPELLVSLLAASRGSVELAVGNAVGSVTANTGLILAISVLALAGPAARRDYLGKSLLLLAAVTALWWGSRDGALSQLGSGLLGLLFLLFLWENLGSARRARAQGGSRPQVTRGQIGKNALAFVAGTAGVVLGAELLVDSAGAIATLLGLPQAIVAVTIVAVGTSLPELVTTVTAITKGEGSLSAGNILGANIIDTTLILPLSSLVADKGLPIGPQALALDLPVCLAINLLALAPALAAQRFMRWQGAALLGCYLGYLAVLVLR